MGVAHVIAKMVIFLTYAHAQAKKTQIIIDRQILCGWYHFKFNQESGVFY